MKIHPVNNIKLNKLKTIPFCKKSPTLDTSDQNNQTEATFLDKIRFFFLPREAKKLQKRANKYLKHATQKQQEAKRILEKQKEIQANSKKYYQKTEEIIPDIIRQLEYFRYQELPVLERSDDKVAFRTYTIKEDESIVIREEMRDGKKRRILANNGLVSVQVYEGKNFERAQEQFYFNMRTKKPIGYFVNSQMEPGYADIDERYIWDGRKETYEINFTSTGIAPTTAVAQECYSFEDSELAEYGLLNKFTQNGHTQTKEAYTFLDGEVDSYSERIYQENEKGWSGCDFEMAFDSGKLATYTISPLENPRQERFMKQVFQFEGSKLHSVDNRVHELLATGEEFASKKYLFKGNRVDVFYNVTTKNKNSHYERRLSTEIK